MSHDAHAAPAGKGSDPLKAIADASHKLVTPHENAKAQSIFKTISDLCGSTLGLVKQTVKTAVDVPMGLFQAAAILPVNVLAYSTKIYDKYISQNIDHTRAAIQKLIDHPLGTGGHGGNGHAHVAGAH